MGWDIHAIVQVLVGGKWIIADHQPCEQDRDYELFGILAGARRNGPPIAPLRGLPADFFPGDYWMGDHSFSHYTLVELNDRYHRSGFVRECDYLVGNMNYLPMVKATGSVLVVSEANYFRQDDETGYVDHEVYIYVKCDEEECLASLVNSLGAIQVQYDVPPTAIRYVFGFDS